MKLMLIRHAVTDWNTERRMQGQTDVPINEEGRAQAERLRPIIAHLAPQWVVTSGLQRTIQTAEAAHLHIDKIDPRLNEFDLGEWEGQLIADLDPKEYEGWGMGEFSPPGGERMDAFFFRVNQAIFEVLTHARANDIEMACVVAHGGVIRRYLARGLGLDISKMVNPRHAGVSVLDVQESGMRLEMYNYTGF
ncbi:histidine phosphatase family protein [Corynebacterium cystitidis]|uniref:histidine phosphatase family protein n=1 Tax=Corynebacterium cystitidis TaxID=35757 RepID=UPI00211E4BC6|nr:histidine phosphatase family protein [Corynebacterium cystitidis]